MKILLVLAIAVHGFAGDTHAPTGVHGKLGSADERRSASKIIACKQADETPSERALTQTEISVTRKGNYLEIQAEVATQLEDLTTKTKQRLADPYYWAMAVEPEWAGKFTRVGGETVGKSTVARYQATNEAERKNGFAVSTLTIAGETVYLVRSAPKAGDPGRGTDKNSNYYNFTIFDTRGNLMRTTVTVPIKPPVSADQAKLHTYGNYYDFCPAQRALDVWGFEVPLQRRLAKPEALIKKNPDSAINDAIRSELLKLVL